MRSEKLVRGIALLVIVAVTSFTAGVWGRNAGWWIARELTTAQQWWNRYLETGTFAPEKQVFVPKNGMPESQMVFHSSEGNPTGYLAIMQWNHSKKEYGVRLLESRSGNQVHYWPIDYDMLDPDGPRNGHGQPHGLSVYSDGSIVVNFDLGDAIARLDECGNPLWVRQGVFHHLISQDDDGSLWTWEGENTSKGQFQFIVNLDADTGNVIRKISLVDDTIRKHNLWDEFQLEKDFKFRHFDYDPDKKHDRFHPNDVEPLPERLADKFPQFNSGDLLVSFRNIDAVAVIDRNTANVKWINSGPWRRQHDPDFGEDGNITVFNNLAKRGVSSNILSIDPDSGTVTNNFNGGNPSFYTSNMGVHQVKPNGHTLIVSSGEGRVIEVDEEGEIHFEYFNIVNEKSLGHVQNALWLDHDFFQSIPACN